MIQLKDIKRNPNNPRKINEDKFAKLLNSIKEFPKMMALRPIIVNDDNIVLGGNMRLEALKELGYKEVPEEWIKKASDLTDEEVRRFIIQDNVGYGEWDWELLNVEWNTEQLSDWGLDVFKYEPFKGSIDDFFEESDKKPRKKVLLCPHCGKNIYDEEEEEDRIEE
jgi:hypothetical protein